MFKRLSRPKLMSDAFSRNMDTKDISKRYKYGSVEWQDAMQRNIIDKRLRGEHIDSSEKIFEDVQREHNKDQLEFEVVGIRRRK